VSRGLKTITNILIMETIKNVIIALRCQRWTTEECLKELRSISDVISTESRVLVSVDGVSSTNILFFVNVLTPDPSNTMVKAVLLAIQAENLSPSIIRSYANCANNFLKNIKKEDVGLVSNDGKEEEEAKYCVYVNMV
jgi:hypothetical protein